MTNRTICCLAASFALGICYGREQEVWLCLSAIVFILWRVFAVRKEQGQKAVLPAVFQMLFCMLLFGMGAYHYCQQKAEFEQACQYAKGQGTIQVQGNIYWKEQKKEQFIYYLKDAGILSGKHDYPCGRIQVYSSTDSYQIGNCLKAEGWYEAFSLPRNEGNFNEEQYYYSKNINLRIKTYQEQILSEHTDGYQEWLLGLRKQMEQVFLNTMSGKTAGIMANMVLGNKNLADPEIKALYQKVGISHVLAVSGLHVSLFGMGIYRLLRRIYCPIPLASVMSAGVVWSFGMLTGMELSTVRAVIMFLMMMSAGAAGYTYDTLTALGISALLQLWENPFVLWYAGFLLSYTAVFGAVVIAGIVKQDSGNKKGKKVFDTIKTSICIQMATLPVLVFFYCEVSGYSIPVNGCVLPFMGVLLFLGASGGITGLFCSEVSVLLLKGAEGMLKGCEWLCHFFAELPGNSIITGSPSLEKVILYYILLALVLYLVQKRKKKKYLFTWIGLAVILYCGNQQKGAEVDFLDVGQGDGIFLQSKQGKGVFVDGGSTDVGKVGTYRILPFLKYRGMKEISLWFVSHADEDHISGLKEILEEGYPVKNIVFAEGMVEDEAWKHLVQQARENGSKIYYLQAGESITLNEMRFTVLYPREKGPDRNSSSMVLLAELEGMNGILSGDIGKEQEIEILRDEKMQKYIQKSITFYKAAHHGSDNSNSLEFLEKLSPGISVISCGERNSYGHPGKEAVERMEISGTKIFYTMKSGQIKVKCDGRGIWVKKYKS